MSPETSGSKSPLTVRTAWSWLLVGGCPRSGTTLLQLILNTHPNIRLTNELSLFQTLDALRPAFAREAAFQEWQERAKSHKENWTKDTLAPFIPRFHGCAGRMLRGMYEAQFDDQIDIATVKYFGDKLPMYYDQDIDKLEALIGEVTIIHLSRNPIDVVNSMLRRSRNSGFNRDTWNLVHSVEEGCKQWARAWNAIQHLSKRRGAKVVHVKYEDLLSSTAKFLADISTSLGVVNSFDAARVVAEDPDIRDLVGPADIARIDELLGGLPEKWSDTLEDLMTKFGQIHMPER